MTRTPYVLLALAGQSPQVVTETVWSLARQHQPALIPVRVVVVSTAVGAAYVRARLLGETAYDPVTGAAVTDAEDRWTPLCRDVLGRPGPVPLEVCVPEVRGLPLEDVQSPSDDEVFADLCYRLTAELTGPDALPLVGSIAGGRKTMSAHLMTAFSVHARPQDRLTHVLMTPDPGDRTLDEATRALVRRCWYPDPSTAGRIRVRRVDVAFPRLRTLLRQAGLARPEGGHDLRSLLEALEPHVQRDVPPHRFEVVLAKPRTEVRALDADGNVLGVCDPTPNEAATLLVLIEALRAGGGSVRVGDLYPENGSTSEAMKHAVHVRRLHVLKRCGVQGTVAAWTKNRHVSRARSDVAARLAAAPVLERYLACESEGRESTLRYALGETLPGPVQVRAETQVPGWPFEHVELLG